MSDIDLSMWRRAYNDLIAWKDSENRMPLLMRGVRQSGKTYLLRKFGEERFDNTVYVNLESEKGIRSVFDRDLDPSRIIEDISSIKGEDIVEGRTLVILDEIQACPDAITSLKYFCEEAPGYHVAAAGSLLGVALARKGSFPVGKVDLMTMRPMDFEEFLVAIGEGRVVDRLRSTGPFEASGPVIERLEQAYLRYLFVGGMPRVVGAWVDGRGEDAVKEEQDRILMSYDSDFLKHVPSDEGPKVSRVWESVPQQLAAENGRFFYNHVKGGKRAAELEDAVQWLTDAGLLHRVGSTDSPGVPLGSVPDGGLFKLYMCDVGLLSRMVGAELPMYTYDSVRGLTSPDFRGAVAENYVLNEIVSTFGRTPRYWRDGRYEVDFLMPVGTEVVPIETKSGWKTRATSLGRYIDEYSPRKAAVLSMNPPEDGDVVKLPLCLTWMLRDVLEGAYDGRTDTEHRRDCIGNARPYADARRTAGDPPAETEPCLYPGCRSASHGSPDRRRDHRTPPHGRPGGGGDGEEGRTWELGQHSRHGGGLLRPQDRDPRDRGVGEPRAHRTHREALQRDETELGRFAGIRGRVPHADRQRHQSPSPDAGPGLPGEPGRRILPVVRARQGGRGGRRDRQPHKHRDGGGMHALHRPRGRPPQMRGGGWMGGGLRQGAVQVRGEGRVHAAVTRRSHLL